MSALYRCLVTHCRLAPTRHRLRYRIFTLLLDLAALDDEASSLRLFSRNRFNLVALYDRDYGDGRGPLAWARAQMEQAGMETAGSRILLLTMPRLLGYAFNPLSVYFCHGADGALRAILYEVRNTFGQRHSYFIAVAGEAGEMVQQSCAKDFYVSPFMDMAMGYEFTLRPPGEKLALLIKLRDAHGIVLTAALTGRRTSLTDAALLRGVAAYPLMTLKVVAGIHWEALRLWLKGVKLRPRPAPPVEPVSFVRDAGRVA